MTATPVRLRPATPRDEDAILALPGLGRSTRRLLPRDLAGELPRHVLVAHAGADVVGFECATRQPDEVHLLDIAVARSRRRRGIAGALVARLAALALADGARSMTLEVRMSNAPALGLYRGMGFDDHGVRPGYYQDGEDAVIMWHHDLAGLATLVPDETPKAPAPAVATAAPASPTTRTA